MKRDCSASTATRPRSSLSRTLDLLLFVVFTQLIANLYSCAGPRPGSVDPLANTKVVAVLWPSVQTVPLTPERWRASPWFRSEDIITPSRVVIAVDRYACIMRDGDVSNPKATERFYCVDGWRYPRSRGR